MIVLDTLVVLKWIFDDEAGSERAARLKDSHITGHEIVAVPDLLFYEIGNVLATKTRLSEEAIAEVTKQPSSWDVLTSSLGKFSADFMTERSSSFLITHHRAIFCLS